MKIVMEENVIIMRYRQARNLNSYLYKLQYTLNEWDKIKYNISNH